MTPFTRKFIASAHLTLLLSRTMQNNWKKTPNFWLLSKEGNKRVECASIYGVCFISHLIQSAERNRGIIWMPVWGTLRTKASPIACYSNRETAVPQIVTRWSKRLWALENRANIFNREFTHKPRKDTFQKMLRSPS